MRSYVNILTELKDTIISDTPMPTHDKIKIIKLVDKLFDLLWKYSY